MDRLDDPIPSNVPLMLISGSYGKVRVNDKLCKYIGSTLAQSPSGIISAGAKPAMKVAESMYRAMDALDQYDPYRIVTIYRMKGRGDKLLTKRFGCNVFVGNDIEGVRSFIFSQARALIVIGGRSRTREEILKAQDHGIPIIPLGISGGTASEIWK